MAFQKAQGQKDMKASNIMTVFDLIKQEGELSRADIAKILKMSATSITRIISLLSELNIVSESHLNSQRVGRRSMLLHLTPNVYYFCTAAIDSDQIVLSIFTMTGEELACKSEPTSGTLRVEEACEILSDLYHKALTSSNLSDDKIVYVGVSIIGLVDDTKGLSLFVPQFGWKMTQISDQISRVLQKPVCINNDVKAMLLGILHEMPAYLNRNMVLLHVGTGIGAAYYYNHRIVRGSNNLAGEIGHTLVDPEGIPCDCGRRGCLQTKIVEKFLIQQAHSQAISGETLEDILAQEYEPQVQKLKQDVISYLSMAICNLDSVFNPDQIIITGTYVDKYPELVGAAIAKAKSNFFFPGQASLQVVIKDHWNLHHYHLLGMFYSAQQAFVADLVKSNVATPY